MSRKEVILWLMPLILGTLGLVFLIVQVAGCDISDYNTVILCRGAALYFILAVPLMIFKSKELKWGIVDILMLCLLLSNVLSCCINGQIASYAAIQELFPYCLIYFATKTFASIYDKCFGRILFLCLCFWLISESIVGLSQVFGKRMSGHMMFGMTGSFANPGPYGGFLAIIMSISTVYALRHYRQWQSFRFRPSPLRLIGFSMFLIALVASSMGILVLPATMSRAAWLAYGVSLILYLSIETDLFKSFIRKRNVALISIVILAILIAGIISLKVDSAIGRLQIWHMELRAVLDSPLIGTGPGTAMGTYGVTQEEFFRTAGQSMAKFTQVAGCPEYAFNEYLKTGIEAGLPGLIFSVALTGFSIVLLLRKRSVLAYGMIAVATFSFFSYPLSVVQIATLTIILLAFASCATHSKHHMQTRPAGRFILSLFCVVVMLSGAHGLSDTYKARESSFEKWQAVRQWGTDYYDDIINDLEPLYGDLSWNYRYLYDYGYALHKAGMYIQSNNILSAGASISSDPMFHNIMGKNYEALGLYDEAENEYFISHYMVPCRLYPLVLLLEMYQTQGRESEAVAIRKQILSMPINSKNQAMVDLRKRAESQQFL